MLPSLSCLRLSLTVSTFPYDSISITFFQTYCLHILCRWTYHTPSFFPFFTFPPKIGEYANGGGLDLPSVDWYSTDAAASKTYLKETVSACAYSSLHLQLQHTQLHVTSSLSSTLQDSNYNSSLIINFFEMNRKGECKTYSNTATEKATTIISFFSLINSFNSMTTSSYQTTNH